jgi:D-beta-D-heptose 7-phosphate kinase/D-beta-D-heptose 1-phosphate adenosyltransferase
MSHVLVIGDVMIDHYIWGGCERISPEAPVQVVDVKEQTQLLGGAGNVINNLLSLGLDVSLASVVGDDDNAQVVNDLLQAAGAEALNVVEAGRLTTKKSRVMAQKSQVLRLDQETRTPISSETESALLDLVRQYLADIDMVLVSDYGKGVCTPSLLADVIKLAQEKGKKVLVDPKGQDFSKYQGAYLLTPNRKELQQATDIAIDDEQSLIKALAAMQQVTNSELVMATLSEDGIALFDDELTIIPTVAKEVYDVTGAGDTVIAALAYALLQQQSPQQAVEFANMAAGVVVGKIGSATVTIDEIEQYQSSLHRSSVDTHIKTWDEIKRIADTYRQQGKKSCIY